MYRGFIAALSGEYRASAGPGLAYRTSLKARVRRDIVKRAEAHKVYDEDATQIHMEVAASVRGTSERGVVLVRADVL